jgi:hypothetical protein
MPIPILEFASAPIVTPGALAFPHGTGAVWLPARNDGGDARWRCVELGEVVVALAECALGSAAVTSGGRRLLIDADGSVMDLDVAGSARRWRHVWYASGFLAFVDTDGRVELVAGSDRFMRAPIDGVEGAQAVACGGSCVVTADHEGTLRVMANPLRRAASPYDAVVEHVVGSVRQARSISTDGETVAIVDMQGVPHIVGPGTALISLGLPISPLAAIAVGARGYAAALTESGAVHLLGLWAGTQTGSALSECAWRKVMCGAGWVSITDGEAAMAMGEPLVAWLGPEPHWTDRDGRTHSMAFAINGLLSVARATTAGLADVI